jgi:hypothetical protein
MKLDYTFWDLPDEEASPHGIERVIADVRALHLVQLGIVWSATIVCFVISFPSTGPAAMIFASIGLFSSVFAIMVSFAFLKHVHASREILRRVASLEVGTTYRDIFRDFPVFFTTQLLRSRAN